MAVYFYGCMSLDGYLADKNHEISWLHELGSVEETSYESFYQEMDVLLLGKKTYDEIKDMDNLEDFYGPTENIVFTHEKGLESPLFKFVSEDVVAFVESLPKDKNVWVVGGNTLIAPLLDKGLIETMYVQVAPVLLGEGVPLFTQKEGKQLFDLVEVKQYGQFAELILKKHLP